MLGFKTINNVGGETSATSVANIFWVDPQVVDVELTYSVYDNATGRYKHHFTGEHRIKNCSSLQQ